MLAITTTSTNLMCCNLSSLPLKNLQPKASLKTLNPNPNFSPLLTKATIFNTPHLLYKTTTRRPSRFTFHRKDMLLQSCHSSLKSQNPQNGDVNGEPGGGNEEGRDWTTSILLFAFYGGLMYYVFTLAPDQTPSRDMYFLKKLLNLAGNDGFRMNQVLASLWYIMGLWPLVYSMLLTPSGRSSKGSIPVWPFLILSCFGGAYALLPYFVLWKPPPPPVEENELTRWPLNFLESKLTAGFLCGKMQVNSIAHQISLAAGLGIIVLVVLAIGEWNEFYQYFRESKFIHIMSIDFTLLSTFAPFWVYNDMTARKWYDKGSWLLPVSLVPFLGPALYLVLRPFLSEMPVSLEPTASDQEST